MSIATELTLLANSKQAIKNSINAKGGSITDSTPFADYSTAIDNLPSGGSNADLIDLIERDATTLTIPNGTTNIGKSAFRDYDGLTSVTIPSGVTKIGDNAFDGCSGLTSITIPSGVTTIGENVFNDCTSLATITVPDSVTEIGANTFEDTQWYAAQDDGNIYGYSIIAGKVFYKLVDKEAHNTSGYFFPNDCHSIADSAFASLQPDSTIQFANNTTITTIGKNAFRNLATFNSISWLKAVTKIRYNAFDGTGWYNNQADGEVWVRNVLYKYKGTMPSDTKVSIIRSSIDYITDYAFQGCTGLSQLIMPNVATPPAMGDGVFDSTNDTFKIYVPAASVNAYKAASGWSSYATHIYGIEQLATVDGTAVYNYTLDNTNSAIISDTQVTALPSGTGISFAEGVTTIQGQLGAYERVTLPSTFTTFFDANAIDAATEILRVNATTPPAINRNQLGGSGLTAIYVPVDSVATYQAASGWSTFSSIIQGPPTIPRSYGEMSAAELNVADNIVSTLDGITIYDQTTGNAITSNSYTDSRGISRTFRLHVTSTELWSNNYGTMISDNLEGEEYVWTSFENITYSTDRWDTEIEVMGSEAAPQPFVAGMGFKVTVRVDRTDVPYDLPTTIYIDVVA